MKSIEAQAVFLQIFNVDLESGGGFLKLSIFSSGSQVFGATALKLGMISQNRTPVARLARC